MQTVLNGQLNKNDGMCFSEYSSAGADEKGVIDQLQVMELKVKGEEI